MTAMADTSAREMLIRDLTGSVLRSRLNWRWTLTGLACFGFALIAFVPIDSGVAAQGLLHPTQPRQVIQHPTGGVVRQILVRDGQVVSAGQALIKLDDTQERAAYSAAKFQALSLRAELAVRQAEVRGVTLVEFPAELTEMAAHDTDVRGVLAAQMAAFEARKSNYANQTAQFRQQVTKNTLAAAQAQARATASYQQLALVKEEAVGMRSLLEKGYTPKARVLALERAEASLAGEAAALSAEVKRLQAENAELQERLEQPDLAARVQASEAMRTVMTELAAAQDKYLAARAALDRTVLRAPMAGTAMSLRATTIGGVIRPSEPAIEIVPAGNEMQLKARIKLVDADNIKAGDTAAIRFDMLQGTTAPIIEGRVTTMSADAVEDPRTGEAYFEAKITIPPEQARRVSTNVLAPGRPAEVLIKTGRRTLLSYFLLPLQRAQFKALREQ